MIVLVLTILFFVVSMAENIYISAGTYTSSGFDGDGGPATSATLNYPNGCSLDTTGAVFIADNGNNVIRKVDASGIISTIFGNGANSLAGNGGAATAASGYVTSVRSDTVGNLFVTDAINQVVRRIFEGSVYAFAGGGSNYNNDVAATSATLGIMFDSFPDTAGNLYVPTSLTIKKIPMATGITSVIAGTDGFATSEGVGLNGDGGPATSAVLSAAYTLWIDTSNHLYFTAVNGYSVRRVDLNTGIISYIAGNGLEKSFVGDGVTATNAGLGLNPSVSSDTMGNLYLSNRQTPIVRKLVATSGIVSYYAGGGTSDLSTDGQPATSASMDRVVSVFVQDDKVYLTDYSYQVVLVVFTPIPTASPTEAPTAPTVVPSPSPSLSPSNHPTLLPTMSPTYVLTFAPSVMPSITPSLTPTVESSVMPTMSPSFIPTVIPSISPSTAPSEIPSFTPSTFPSFAPSKSPTLVPTAPTKKPTARPSLRPTRNSLTANPTLASTIAPTAVPTTHVDISFNVSLYLFNTSVSSLSGADKSAVVSAVSESMNVSSGDVSVSGSIVTGSDGGRRLTDVGAPPYDLLVSLAIHVSTANYHNMNGSVLYRDLRGALYNAVVSNDFSLLLASAAHAYSAYGLYYVSDVNVTISAYSVVPVTMSDGVTDGNGDDDDGVSNGDFAGIVIGVIVSFMILVACCYYAVAYFNSSDVIRNAA